MRKPMRVVAILIVLAATVVGARAWAQSQAPTANDAELLKAREAVWRAWFAGDVATLKTLVPADTIVMSGGEAEWKDQAKIIQEAEGFHAAGGKLTKLQFSGTKIQRYGDVAIVWSNYSLETDMNGKSGTETGRASEIFVLRDGKWVNPGWHTDSGK